MANSNADSIPYHPLEENEFRLLLILPGQPSDDLICTLVHASYDTPPPYEALSYVWGNPEPPFFLECSDARVRVTGNLHGALCHFRLESQIRIVWADALCIDQSNDVEKGVQVNRMREIYANCAKLLVWFGVPDPGVAEDACEGLRRLRILFEENTDVEIIRNVKRARGLHGVVETQEKLNEWERWFDGVMSTDPLSTRYWKAIGKFFNCSWFTRVWIVQEVISAPGHSVSNMTLAYGDTEFDWETVSIVVGGLYATRNMEHVARYTDYPDLNASPTRLIQIVDNARSTRRTTFFPNEEPITIGGYNSVFWEFLITAQRLSSTDPRDKIYGMLGVIEPDVRSTLRIKLQPDYTKSAVDLYTDVTLFFIFDEHCLDILELTYDQPDHGSRIPGLPSWVNDWTQKSYLEPFHPWYANWGAGGSNGGLGTKLGFTITPHRPKVSNDRRRLGVKAYFAGTIQWHVPPESEYVHTPAFAQHQRESSYDDEEEHQFLRQFFLNAARYRDCLVRVRYACAGLDFDDDGGPPPKDVQYCVTGESLYEAFWRTLICNLDGNGDIPDPSVEELFECFHAWQMITQNTRKSLESWSAERFKKQERFQRRWALYGRERRFFVSLFGLMGWATQRAQVGDHIAVIAGARCPYILRRIGDKYELVGPAYVHGLMEAPQTGYEPKAAHIALVDPPKDIWLI
jgi:hypothetical protein